jgi:anti-sigma factor RsiW
MSYLDEHAEILKKLPLLIAGSLDADDEARIARHTATCPDCANELERWRLIAAGLRRLATPQPSSALFERTRMMVVDQLAAKDEQRLHWIAIIFLVLFSWTVTLVSWPVFRLATGGLLSLFGIRYRQIWVVFAIFSALTWLGGGSAALLLSLRRQHERRLAL